MTKNGDIVKTTYLTRAQPKVVESFGHCIYCGKKDLLLSREHVLPRSLEGGFIILGASCDECAEITKKFEQEFARINFGHHRLKEKYRSDHPDEQPKTLKLKIKNSNGEFVDEEVSIEDHPSLLAMPILPIPRIISQKLESSNPKQLEMMTYFKGGSFDAYLEYKFNLDAFYQTLAKMAHGFALGDLGEGIFEPMLPDLILGKKPELGSYLIGANPHQQFGPRLDHKFGVNVGETKFDNQSYIRCYIQLFGDIFDEKTNKGTPSYCVIVGKQIKPFPLEKVLKSKL